MLRWNLIYYVIDLDFSVFLVLYFYFCGTRILSYFSPYRKVFGTGVGPSRRPVDAGLEKWHYNGIRRKDGIVVPPMPDKKKPVKPVNSAVYSPTPVLPAVNSISPQVAEARTVATITPPQLVSTAVATTQPENVSMSPSSPILKAQLSAPLRPSPPPAVRPPQVSSSHCLV